MEKETVLEKWQRLSREKRERAPKLKIIRSKQMKKLVAQREKEKKKRLAEELKLNKLREKEAAKILREEQKAEKKREKIEERILKKEEQAKIVKVKKRRIRNRLVKEKKVAKKIIELPGEMMESFRRGEEKGFVYCFNFLYDQLFYYAKGITKDDDAAKDCVSNGFLIVSSKRGSFENLTHLKVWMYTTVRNLCLNELHRISTNERHMKMLGILVDEECESHDMEIIRQERYKSLHERLNKLPEGCRKIIMMLYFDKKPPNEICDELGVAIQTVKTQKARGLRLLRNLFNVSEEEYLENEKKKVYNIQNSEASYNTIGMRYRLCYESVRNIKLNGIKDVKNMRKIV